MSSTCRFGRIWLPPNTVILPLVDRVIGEDVDRQIEPRARAVAADRRRTDHDAGEVVGLVLPQQRLAHALELVVERERHQRMVLGHVGRVADAVDRARRAVDEALHAGRFGREHHRLEAIVVDGLGQLLVELEARIVRDAGEMQDGVLTLQRLGQPRRVADVALDHAQVRAVRQPAAEIERVVDGDVIALGQQPRRQHVADITGAAGDEHVPNIRGHDAP